jgi:hypothetical protein
MEKGSALSGMKEIAAHCGAIGLQRTESSIIQLKLQYGFPMKKLLGIWLSDKLLIDEWRKKYISGEVETQPAALAKANRKADRH